mgnify:CR=1 FL=1
MCLGCIETYAVAHGGSLECFNLTGGKTCGVAFDAEVLSANSSAKEVRRVREAAAVAEDDRLFVPRMRPLLDALPLLLSLRANVDKAIENLAHHGTSEGVSLVHSAAISAQNKFFRVARLLREVPLDSAEAELRELSGNPRGAKAADLPAGRPPRRVRCVRVGLSLIHI